ncbi:hypothetical protein ACJX0J_035619, partial [Zea mays]
PDLDRHVQGILAMLKRLALAFFFDLHLIILENRKHAFLIDYKYYYTAYVVDKLSDNYIIYVGGINLRSTLLCNI